MTRTLPSRFALLALLSGLTACGPESASLANEDADRFCARTRASVAEWVSGQPALEAGAERGGHVIVGANQDLPGGMNVAATADYNTAQHQQFVNLMTLVDYGPDLEPRPYLAESWSMAEGGTGLTFRLRDDVVWHDGHPTDAGDVAFTFRLLRNPAAGFPNATYFAAYPDGPEAVEVLDQRTVRFRFDPHAQPLDVWRAVAILPEHLLGDVPPEELAAHPFGTVCPVGNGPFIFAEHRDGDSWTFEANPGFPEGLGGPPRVDRYTYRVIPDASTLLAEALSGSLDVYVAAQPDQAQEITEDPDLELMTFPSRGYTFVAWNARRPFLSDPRVRRAFTLAVDRGSVVEALLHGYGSVAHGTLPPFHWAYREPPAEPLPDTDAALSLLAEAGYRDRNGDGQLEDPDGEPLGLTILLGQGNPRFSQIAQIVQAQLGEIGVVVELEVLEWGTFVDRATAPEHDYDALVLSWIAEFKVDDTDLFASDRIQGSFAFSGLLDERLDELLAGLRREIDRERAAGLWAEYEYVLDQLQPFTFFYYPDRLAAVHRRLNGVRMDPRGEWLSVREWWIDPEARR